MNELLEKIYQESSIDNKMDVIFKYIDDRMLDDEFEKIDQFFDAIDINKLEENNIIAIIAITYCGMDKLQRREEFINRAEIRLMELLKDKERIDKLLNKRRKTA